MKPKFEIGQDVYYVDKTMGFLCNKDDENLKGRVIFSVIPGEVSFPNFNVSYDGTLGWISYTIDEKDINQDDVFKDYDSALERVELLIKLEANREVSDEK